MKPTRIDLNDYVRTGEGANGASFLRGLQTLLGREHHR